MNIVVTGSLGHISKPLTKNLLAKGHQVTVISSSPERKSEIEALGAEAAIGSAQDAGFLEDAFNGADAVYCMIPPNYFDEPDIIAYYKRIAQNYAQTIESSGVKRVVHLSSFGAHLDEGTGPVLGSHHVEEILNDLSGVNVTHMRPAYFYYNLYNYIDMIKDQDVIMANYGADSFPLVSPKDIAPAVAEELQKTNDTPSVRYVASDERSGFDIASVLGEAIDKLGLQWKIVSDEDVQKGLKANGMPKHIASSMVDMYASIRSGRLAEDYYAHRPEKMGETKLEDFAKDFARTFYNN